MNPEDFQLLRAQDSARQDFAWGGLTWFASGPLGNAHNVTTGRCVLKPGRGNPRHYHPNCTEWLTVLSGEIEHTGPGGEPLAMGPGDTITIAPNVWHCANNTGQTEAVLLIVFDSADRQTVGE